MPNSSTSNNSTNKASVPSRSNTENTTTATSDDQASETSQQQFLEEYDKLVAVDDAMENSAQNDDEYDDEWAGQHPALKQVCVIDCKANRRIVPNAAAVDLDNECFTGKVMLLMRTPDVDERPGSNESPPLGEIPAEISNYFRGKKRCFEFQFEVKLKKVPSGPLFLGCELEHPIKVGAMTKGLAGILLAMVRRINPGFHYSWGVVSPLADEDFKSGNFEKTHLSFPVEASMDRIVITKAGQKPPVLGSELYESNESVKRRRKMGAGSVDWNLQDTYTMCLWSAYADWIKWRSLNVPGVSPFSLCRVTGTQPIYLSVYEITSCDNAEYKKKRPPHLFKDLKIYTRLEFTHEEKTTGGLAEKLCGIGAATHGTHSELGLSTSAGTGSASALGAGGVASSSDHRHHLLHRPPRVGLSAEAPAATGGVAARAAARLLHPQGSKKKMSSAANATNDNSSLPDTESVDSDFETASRITMM